MFIQVLQIYTRKGFSQLMSLDSEDKLFYLRLKQDHNYERTKFCNSADPQLQ